VHGRTWFGGARQSLDAGPGATVTRAITAGATELRLRDVLARCVDLYADDVAVVFGDERITWAELARRAFRLANALRAEGVERGDRVAVLQTNGPEVVELGFACAVLGAALVPLSSRLVLDEVRYVLADAAPRVAFVEPTHPAANERDFRVLATRTPDFAAFRDAAADVEPPEIDTADDPVLLLYTSGTTGRPKGAQHSQRTMIQNGLTVLLSQQLDHRDAFLSTTPLTHAAAGTRIFSLAVDGLKHVIMDRFTVAGFFELVANERITTTILVPTMLADVVDSPLLDTADLSSMRFIVYGAAPTPEALVARALERLPCGLLQGYGLTEGSPALTALTPDEHRRFAADPELRRRLRSMGRPVPGVRARVVDGAGERLPAGEAGELQVRSTKTMLQYWRAPELTEAAFDDGWLATGDIVTVDEDGYLYLVDRKKDMLISGGLNVYPSEIERVLREDPAVREAAVVGTHDDRWGEVPIAFVVLGDDADDQAGIVTRLRAHCRDRLAGYKQPRELRIVDALPRNETGKVHKPTLRNWAAHEGVGEAAGR